MTDIVERLREQPTMSIFANIGDMVGRLNHEREEAADEIERLRKENQELKLQYLSDQGEWIEETGRLREVLRHYVSECDCNGGTYYEDDHITGKTLVKDCPKCEPARATLREK